MLLHHSPHVDPFTREKLCHDRPLADMLVTEWHVRLPDNEDRVFIEFQTESIGVLVNLAPLEIPLLIERLTTALAAPKVARV